MKTEIFENENKKFDLLNETFTTECDLWDKPEPLPQALSEVLCEVEHDNAQGDLSQRRAYCATALRAIW